MTEAIIQINILIETNAKLCEQNKQLTDALIKSNEALNKITKMEPSNKYNKCGICYQIIKDESPVRGICRECEF
jgi:hypothetical protein